MPLPNIEEIVASPNLPSLPAVTVRIIELVQDPAVSLRLLSEAVSTDAPLAIKLLKQANSSFYARPRTISKLTEAFMVLGLRRVKTLALGFSLVDGRRGEVGGFDYTAFWRRSLLAAVGARLLASRLRELDKALDEEEAFLCGLIHRLGVLALNEAAGPDYQALFAGARGDYDALLGIEARALSFDHAELGGRLGEQWDLPHQLTAALRWSATPQLAGERERTLIRCVSAGSAAADIFTCETPGPAVLRYRERCSRWFNLTPKESDGLLARIQSSAASLGPILDLPDAAETDLVEILSEANAATEANSSSDGGYRTAEAVARSGSFAFYAEWLQANHRLERRS